MPAKDWELVAVLPNLVIPKPLRPTGRYLMLVGPDAPEVASLCDRSAASKQLIGGFIDSFGRPVEPSVLLLARAASARLWDYGPLIAFRNLRALAITLRGWASHRPGEESWSPLFSDHFDLHPVTIGKGDTLLTDAPGTLGYRGPGSPFVGMPSPHIGRNLLVAEDSFLLDAMYAVWERRFVAARRSDRYAEVLFRSLQVAYQARAAPFKNRGTLYDLGASLAAWVSAIEILVHPTAGHADLERTLAHLDRFTVSGVAGGRSLWQHRDAARRHYTIQLSKKKRRKGNLVQYLYKRLYDARNAFLHGNPIGEKALRPHPARATPKTTVWEIAPVIYRIVLYIYLLPELEVIDWDDPFSTDGLRWELEHESYESCLRHAIGRLAADDSDDSD